MGATLRDRSGTGGLTKDTKVTLGAALGIFAACLGFGISVMDKLSDLAAANSRLTEVAERMAEDVDETKIDLKVNATAINANLLRISEVLSELRSLSERVKRLEDK